MTPAPRWITDTDPGHSEWYIERFRQMAAEGSDLAGEARFIDAMVGRDSRLLDAGSARAVSAATCTPSGTT